jgi:hypothetical protein
MWTKYVRKNKPPQNRRVQSVIFDYSAAYKLADKSRTNFLEEQVGS